MTGFDGKAMNFGDEDEVEVIGTMANDNPWEFMHKARFGQPGVAMVGLVALPIQDVVDILAYAQTLPGKKSATVNSMSHGPQLARPTLFPLV